MSDVFPDEQIAEDSLPAACLRNLMEKNVKN